jgi:hypothetical protein
MEVKQEARDITHRQTKRGGRLGQRRVATLASYRHTGESPAIDHSDSDHISRDRPP